MNLTSTLSSPSRFRAAAPAAVAILYPKVGPVLRVPLRRTRTGGAHGCQQHPERQFIRWFTHMAAAQPGFPLQVKSILLITGAPMCQRCYQALAGFLAKYQLAGKLRLRAAGPAPCGCGCGGHCQVERAGANTPLASTLVLDQLLAEAELADEAWWEKAKGLSGPWVGGAMLLPTQGPLKPVRDLLVAHGQAHEKRRRTQQSVDDHTLASRPQLREQELGELESSSLLASVLTQEFEQESVGTVVIHPHIDVHAQYALQRLLSSPDPAAQAEGTALLADIKTGRLRGIYKEDQQVPARWAQERNVGWWTLLGPNDDAAVLLWAGAPYTVLAPPIIIFRDAIRTDASRLDPALRAARQVWLKVQQLKAENPALTPWQLKSIITGQPLPNRPPGRMMSITISV